MSDDLIIKIGADIKEYTDKLGEIGAEAEGLEGKLGKIATVSAVAFAALSAQVVVSVKAFGEAESASRNLTNALQNQGIFSQDLKDSYDEQAESISKLTGIQADEITKAQAVAQSFLGQQPITEDLTKAIADLAVQQGISLPQAATELGKAIGNGTGQLLRQGLQFSATDTEAERYQKTLEFATVKAGGFAEAANQGVGSIKGLEVAFHNTQEELGERFAPAITFIIKGLTDFLTPAEDSTGVLTDLKAAFITVGLVLAGLGIALPIVAQAFLTVKAAVIALEVSAAPLILIPIAIAAIAVGIVELALHWEEATARISAVVKGLVEFVSGAFSGLGKVLFGAFHLDKGKIEGGLKEIQDAFKSSVKTATQELPAETEKALTEQEAVKKRFAEKQAKEKAEQEAARKALQKAETEAILLDLNDESQRQIELKKQEIETLKALEKTKDEEQRELLKDRLTQIRGIETEQQKQDEKRDTEFDKLQLDAQKDLGRKKIQFLTEENQKEVNAIKATLLTEEEVQKKAYTDHLKEEIKAHNTFLEEQNKYGTAYAAINQVTHSTEVEGLKSATGELAQLTQSKNSTLKAIGKAASVAQIVIKTAESAMNIYSGFSVIPFVGPALGIAGAAAAIAFGAEQIGNVVAAQTGGVVPGVGFGDKVPALLEPGELITPRQNFNEVVNSVAHNRSGGGGGSGEVKGEVGIKVGFNGPQASRVITVKQNEDKALGISRAST